MTSDLLQKLSSFGKSGLLSVAMAGAGFAVHVAVAASEQTSKQQQMEAKLADHDAALKTLADGQTRMTGVLNNVAITIARVEGKVDVTNQKIDDDRSAARSRR